MKNIKFITAALSLFIGFSLHAQTSKEEIIEQNLNTIKNSYSGDIPLADVLADMLNNQLPEVKETTVTISIPLVKESNAVSQNVDNLPFDLSEKKYSKSKNTVTISMPFKSSDFEKENLTSDNYDFASHVADFVSQHQVIDDTTENKNATNQTNCGGYALGSVITLKQDLGCLGSVTNTYTCQANPVTGGKSWYVTASTYEASTECIIGPE